MGMGAFLADPCTCPPYGIQGTSRSIFLHSQSSFFSFANLYGPQIITGLYDLHIIPRTPSMLPKTWDTGFPSLRQ